MGARSVAAAAASLWGIHQLSTACPSSLASSHQQPKLPSPLWARRPPAPPPPTPPPLNTPAPPPTTLPTGANTVSEGGKQVYPNGRRGSCGDPHYETKWDVPGQIASTYVSGQTINVESLVAVNHMGKIEVEICPLDAKSRDKCKPLKLVAPGHGNSKSWWLPGINKWGGGNYGGEGPRYGEGRLCWGGFGGPAARPLTERERAGSVAHAAAPPAAPAAAEPSLHTDLTPPHPPPQKNPPPR